MSRIKGRLWPVSLPFTGTIINALTKEPLIRDGFVCLSAPGDFQFKDIDGNATEDPTKVDSMEYMCPRTGKYCGSLPVGYRIKPPRRLGASWEWDGNFEKPTLGPSINCVGGCKWHGWLSVGEFHE